MKYAPKKAIPDRKKIFLYAILLIAGPATGVVTCSCSKFGLIQYLSGYYEGTTVRTAGNRPI